MSTKRTRNELDKDVEIDHRQQRTVTTTTIPTTTATKLSASTSPPPLSKLARIIPTSPTPTNASQSQTEPESQARLLLCTLPPTCNPPHNKPTRLANTIALEAHYAKYHAHVCEERGCGAVFPEGRMLDLHQTECHDPIAAVRKDRGEKIFACFVPTCSRFFQTPKARRLHLIQLHAYPKEYFFAVTNKGVGGLLKRWGEGASLVRNVWKPREGEGVEMDVDEGKDEDEGEDEDGDEEANESDKDHERVKETHTPNKHEEPTATTDVDALVSSMTSLSLVPQTIRFGRGGAKNAVVGAGIGMERGAMRGRGSGGRGGRGRGAALGRGGSNGVHGLVNSRAGGRARVSLADSTTTTTTASPRGQGRGRGRGRGQGYGQGQGQGQGHTRRGSGHSRTSTMTVDLPETDTGNVSINIDGALEALRGTR